MTKNAKGWNSKKLESLAMEIYHWMVKHELWVDTCIYYDGKRLSTKGTDENGKTIYRYNGEAFLDEADPRDYFEYVAEEHILSMSFEGPLYDILNYGFGELEEEFQAIFHRHGVYFELGNSWNLTCCPE